MLVKVLSFGSNWWSRFGRSDEGAHPCAPNTAYYNSTGVRCGSKIRRHWITAGLIRFNPIGGFNPDLPDRAIGQTFICTDLAYAFGGNRLLFQRTASRYSTPDRYLVVVSNNLHGRLDFTSRVWKSVLSELIAASQLREMQEAMLLMRPDDWVQTSTGLWQLHTPERSRRPPGLVRIGDPIKREC